MTRICRAFYAVLLFALCAPATGRAQTRAAAGTPSGNNLTLTFPSGTLSLAGDLTVPANHQIFSPAIYFDPAGTDKFWLTGDATTFTLGLDTNSVFSITSTDFVLSPALSLGAAGVKESGSNGSITWLGLGNGADENLKLDLNTTANTGIFTSSTGLSNLTFTSIGLTAANLTDGGLTSGRVTFASTAGLLIDDADFTFATDTLTATKIATNSVNGLTLTSSTGTVTITNGKTLAVTGTLTLSGTDGTTITFPTTSSTVARTDAANTFTGTQTIGALVATTFNGNTFTTGTGVLTIAASKTLTASNTLTLAGTDGTTITFPSTSATVARTDAANTFTGHQTIEGVATTGATGTNKLVFDTSPTLVTPVLGVATATSVNKVAITAPATSATLVIADGKTFTATETTTLNRQSSTGLPVEWCVACGDETTAITTGTAKVTFRAPYAFTLTEVRAAVNTAPTGSTILVDINESGTTVLSTKLMIDATEKTSQTAATPYVISDAAIADDAELSFDFDQVGSTVAGAGLKVWIKGYR